MKINKIFRLFIGLLLTGFFFWLVFRQTNLRELKQALADTRISWLVAGLLVFLVGYACRIERWRQMLARDNPQLRWQNCVGPLLGSFAINNVLPLRAGDVLRAFAFNQRLGLTSGVVIATIFVERLLDLFVILVFLGVTLSIVGADISRFVGFGSTFLFIVAAIIMLLLLIPRIFSPVAVMLGTISIKIAPRFGEKLMAEINKSLATLQHLSQGSTMLKLVVWSVMSWLAEGCVFWCAALALPSITNPVAGWLALSVGTFATLIPSAPGYVGTFDYFTMQAMAVLGNNHVAATAFALLVHALIWLPPTLIGGLYLLWHPAKTMVFRTDAK